MIVMIDCETWGKRPGFDVRSIGACVFDPVTGIVGDCNPPLPQNMEPLSFYRATDNPVVPEDVVIDTSQVWRYLHFDETDMVFRKYALQRDPETVKWWNDQSAEAQAAFADPVDLTRALNDFSAWLNNLSDERTAATNPSMRIYAHGPQFDISILEAAYHACGLPVPWHYRSPRDTRTVLDMAGIDDDGDGSYRTYLSQFNTGTYHHALDDAIAQAKAMVDAMQRVRRPMHRTFEQAWQPYIDAGYLYGCDALENVEFGWNIAMGLTKPEDWE